MGIQFRFVGSFPQGQLVRNMQFACATVAPGTDGVVVLGPAINLQLRAHVQLLTNATASLAHSGCQHIVVYWACPF